jgi:hypothetical protein
MALLIPLIAGSILLMEKNLMVNRLYCFFCIGLGFALLWTPWQVWSSNQPAGANNLKIVFAYGTYPDFTYKNPNLRGYPDQDDPEFNNMKHSVAHTINILSNRIADDPVKYITWYLIKKPIGYWGWELVQGTGGPFIYPIKKSLYDKSILAKTSLNIMRYVHYILVFLMFAGFLYTIVCIATKRDIYMYETTFLIIFLILAYTTSVHSVLASVPRYSIPFQYFFYICSTYFLTLFFKTHIDNNRLYRDILAKASIVMNKPSLDNKGKKS